jgi:hypothetical protein
MVWCSVWFYNYIYNQCIVIIIKTTASEGNDIEITNPISEISKFLDFKQLISSSLKEKEEMEMDSKMWYIYVNIYIYIYKIYIITKEI